jgi:hypothetical protein
MAALKIVQIFLEGSQEQISYIYVHSEIIVGSSHIEWGSIWDFFFNF